MPLPPVALDPIRRRAALAAMLALPATALARPRKRRAPAAAATPPVRPLHAGQAFWLPELSPTGPAVAMVNLHTQHMQLYRNGVAIAYSSVSTGRPGRGTPTGLFTVLEKRRYHRSVKYNNAPMPWMLRLTWGGIAMHGGALPGYPASHGCIRLPMHFAQYPFSVLARGDAVLIVRRGVSAGNQPLTALAPIDPAGRPLVRAEMVGAHAWWAVDAFAPPLPAPAPPLALLASLPQQRLFALRAGRVMGSAPLPPSAQPAAPSALEGHTLFTWNGAQWLALDGSSALDAAIWRGPLAGEFAARLRPLLAAGSTLVLSKLHAVGDVHIAALEMRG